MLVGEQFLQVACVGEAFPRAVFLAFHMVARRKDPAISAARFFEAMFVPFVVHHRSQAAFTVVEGPFPSLTGGSGRLRGSSFQSKCGFR